MNILNPFLSFSGGVNEYEMLRTFNCGVGLILVVSPSDVTEVLNLIVGEKASVIGAVEKLPAGGKLTHKSEVCQFIYIQICGF